MVGAFSLALACTARPEAQEPPLRDRFRGCSGTTTLAWESPDPNLETYVQELVYDEHGWLVEERYDSSFDQNDRHVATVVRPDGQSEVTTYYYGQSDTVEYQLFSSYGDDDLVDLEELVWG